ncbi:hypothetical protein [Streptomyces griseoruber]|uniref:hypothetical protein n=1 Tax=Streptomyces griseoruber TaxID=1943 RepID=UPI0037B4B178
MAGTYEWPRGASGADSVALETWLGQHGWEVDPTVFMAGARGPAVQVRRMGTDWEDGEAGLLILPGEIVAYDGDRIRIASRPVETADAVSQARRRTCGRPPQHG